MAFPTYSITILTSTPANEGERTDDRVAGTSGEGTRRITSSTHLRRRCRGTREETDPGTVSLSSASSRVDSQMGICRKLEDIRQDLALLGEQGKTKGFFNNVENADKLSGLVEDVRDAMMDYQVCFASNTLTFSCSSFSQTSLQQDIYNRSFLLIVRLILPPFPLRPSD